MLEPIRLNTKFQPFYTTKARYTLISGGRGSGKSFMASLGVLHQSYECVQGLSHKVLYTRFTMQSAELSIIPEFKDKIFRMGRGHEFLVQKRNIWNRETGAEIMFRGIKTAEGVQTANLKSIQGITIWVVDEAEELDEETFDKIDLSIRTKGLPNRVIIILNPTDRTHWIWKRFFENHHRIEYVDGHPVAMSTHPDVCHIHTTYLDNLENLNTNFLELINKIRVEDPERYAAEIIGGWKLQLDGTLFIRSQLRRYRKAELKPDGREAVLAYCDVADEGTDSTSMPIAHVYRDHVYIPEVIHTRAMIDTSAPLCAQALRAHEFNYVRVETNNQGGGFVRELRRLVPAHKVYGARTNANKHTRIVLSYGFVMRYCVFLDDQDIIPGSPYDLFLQELCGYLKVKGESRDHDDAPDALAGLCEFIQGYMPHLYQPETTLETIETAKP